MPIEIMLFYVGYILMAVVPIVVLWLIVRVVRAVERLAGAHERIADSLAVRARDAEDAMHPGGGGPRAW
jgi:hypothetical protein